MSTAAQKSANAGLRSPEFTFGRAGNSSWRFSIRDSTPGEGSEFQFNLPG